MRTVVVNGRTIEFRTSGGRTEARFRGEAASVIVPDHYTVAEIFKRLEFFARQGGAGRFGSKEGGVTIKKSTLRKFYKDAGLEVR